jgi:putative protein-disulfide isomerase
MKPNYILYYCYDAYCGWCYGNSDVINKIHTEYEQDFSFEVLSGGMVLPETPQSIGKTATYIQQAYKRVEEYTGIQFGEDYLWHIFNPDESDWFPNSEKPAIALCIFKELFPERQVAFASDLLFSLHYEGRDLTDNEAYRHLLEKYQIDAASFYEKLKTDTYKEKAYYEFALCKQLQVNGFPTILLQTADTKFYAVTNGYTPFETVKERLDKILAEQ